jgi:hypothetical protein
MSLAGYLLSRPAFWGSRWSARCPRTCPHRRWPISPGATSRWPPCPTPSTPSWLPILVPALFLFYTGIGMAVPVAALMGELAITVIVPAVVAVAIRTRWASRIATVEPVLSATASLAYLALPWLCAAPHSRDRSHPRPALLAARTPRRRPLRACLHWRDARTSLNDISAAASKLRWELAQPSTSRPYGSMLPATCSRPRTIRSRRSLGSAGSALPRP